MHTTTTTAHAATQAAAYQAHMDRCAQLLDLVATGHAHYLDAADAAERASELAASMARAARRRGDRQDAITWETRRIEADEQYAHVLGLEQA